MNVTRVLLMLSCIIIGIVAGQATRVVYTYSNMLDGNSPLNGGMGPWVMSWLATVAVIYFLSIIARSVTEDWL